MAELPKEDIFVSSAFLLEEASSMRTKIAPLITAIILTMLFSPLLSCGKKGGGGGNASTEPPFIYGSLLSLPTGSSLPGYNSAYVEVLDDDTGNPLPNAVVTINGVMLSYSQAYGGYEGNVLVAPGQKVDVNVTIRGRTHSISGTQLTTYPSISQPASGTTWASGLPHMVLWSGDALGLGILDANDPNGELVWPVDGYLQSVPSTERSYTIPANELTAGSRLAFVCNWQYLVIMDAAPESYFLVGGFNYAPFTVKNASLTSIAVTPVDPSVPNGLSQKFTAIGTLSDNSTVDLTNVVRWTSSDMSISTIDNTGKAGGHAVGSATITATYGNVTGQTTLTVTSAVIVSIAVYPQTPVPTIAIGMTQQFTAGATLSDGMGSDVTTTVAWSSSDPAIAVISNAAGSQGTATSLAGGSVTITASVGAVSGSATLMVTNWTMRNSGTSVDLNAVVWSGTKFLVVGSNGTILTSPDGGLWTVQTTSTSETLNDVAWSGTMFVAVGTNGTILTSGNGITWSLQTSGTYENLNGITWSGTQLVAVGDGGALLTSPDGITWEPQSPGTSAGLDDVVWSGTQYVVVGGDDVITSPDGKAWQSRVSRPYICYCSIAWSGDLYVAVTCDRMSTSTFVYPVHTSPDGITWTDRALGYLPDGSPTNARNLLDVIWTGSQFVAVSGVSYGGHAVLTSPDGIVWTTWSSGIPYSGGLRALVWSGTQYVAVGYYGIILTSPSF